ncbi:unnamed protein product [Schistosoma mattheei]|uniref:Uncharacterized protein n=1 Tax=Schistosoma mattheei TaxID=31246 RepID=A0A183NYW1_9TREM|nr:unnamed protein product [Schistosoma mattheei]
MVTKLPSDDPKTSMRFVLSHLLTPEVASEFTLLGTSSKRALQKCKFYGCIRSSIEFKVVSFADTPRMPKRNNPESPTDSVTGVSGEESQSSSVTTRKRCRLANASQDSKNVALAVPILAFTSASEPPCSSMMLLSASSGLLSGPVASPLLICMMTILNSIIGVMTTIGMSVCAASMSDEFNGAGLFKSSSKCSTHLLRYP